MRLRVSDTPDHHYINTRSSGALRMPIHSTETAPNPHPCVLQPCPTRHPHARGRERRGWLTSWWRSRSRWRCTHLHRRSSHRRSPLPRPASSSTSGVPKTACRSRSSDRSHSHATATSGSAPRAARRDSMASASCPRYRPEDATATSGLIRLIAAAARRLDLGGHRRQRPDPFPGRPRAPRQDGATAFRPTPSARSSSIPRESSGPAPTRGWRGSTATQLRIYSHPRRPRRRPRPQPVPRFRRHHLDRRRQPRARAARRPPPVHGLSVRSAGRGDRAQPPGDADRRHLGPGRRSRFATAWFAPVPATDADRSAFVRSIFVDERGDIWVGTTRGLRRLVNGAVTPVPALSEMNDVDVFALFQDREGSLLGGHQRRPQAAATIAVHLLHRE